ncbi:D-sedoheptulose 7-phosphate isomerase [Pseudomonas sp. JS3066]|uniref:D-sedoheptulose 7-phosphate isomerase n=1 Tax=unclassified Pseudomonas TaxID=196821 RepID=UPI000EA89191|nr:MULTISPECIES: D-sedoheptulose 7-phosphate isomerase [unclassified Pseudomonas]AYF88066.1 D-sedoheptulose 7-phosphate isomerase [Pseudomonas sp. DY-1]MDH4654065.1 D-sedoheptulose 7-phosphate isomerase [Pseudomonas sp. BN606]MRK23409.1 D-sedoheptulose 7-phosphate isomerase [Pseudomonas sp. JG-B]WVK94361.1 D-sedoheptulose 7-phosphate isomerase [Pseudomonas sp. JS3066]
MLSHIRNTLEEARRALDNFIANEQTLKNIERAAEFLVESFEKKGKAFSCGNGGSMCDAMHFAEELTGRYRKNRPGVAAISISDASHISCVANDFGYDHIFSRYIESHGREGDVLLAFSTSGRSPNVIKAAEAARALGVKVIALTGKPGSALETLADVCICAPGGDFADRVQELHIKVVHILIELVERKLSPENYA